MNKYILFSKIKALHGIKGEVWCECFFENYEYFILKKPLFLKTKEGSLTLIKPILQGVKKGGLILKFAGIETLEEASRLLENEIFIERITLDEFAEEGKHFVADLINLTVLIENYEESYGKVLDVVDFGGGTLLEVEINHFHKLNKNKKEKLEYYEKTKDTIKEVNLNKGFILLFENILS